MYTFSVIELANSGSVTPFMNYHKKRLKVMLTMFTQNQMSSKDGEGHHVILQLIMPEALIKFFFQDIFFQLATCINLPVSSYICSLSRFAWFWTLKRP